MCRPTPVAFIVAAALALGGCASLNQHACPPGEQFAVHENHSFGTANPTGSSHRKSGRSSCAARSRRASRAASPPGTVKIYTHFPAKNSSNTLANDSFPGNDPPKEPKAKAWLPVGTTHRYARGIERYISTATSTGKNSSRSPWMMRVGAAILPSDGGVKTREGVVAPSHTNGRRSLHRSSLPSLHGPFVQTTKRIVPAWRRWQG